MSRYLCVRPRRRARLNFQEFRELYLAVLRIDKEFPGTGVIDKFITDMTGPRYSPRFPVSPAHVNAIVSLLLLLADRRTQSFPRVLGLVEAMMKGAPKSIRLAVEGHLNNLLSRLCGNEEENRYLISWVLYFLISNRFQVKVPHRFGNLVLKSVQSSRSVLYPKARDFKLFRGVLAAGRAGSMLKHLDVFKPQ